MKGIVADEMSCQARSASECIGALTLRGMCGVDGIEKSGGKSPCGKGDEHAGVGCYEDCAATEFVDQGGTGGC